MADIKLVSSLDDKLGIVRRGKIPWVLPSDRKYWRALADKGPVLMGWNTYKANGSKPVGVGRNYVASLKNETVEGITLVPDAEAFLKELQEDIWVAGGAQIFTLALPYATHLYLTRVHGDFNCDLFFPDFSEDFVLTSTKPSLTENGTTFQYEIWERKSLS